jgi:sn-glycerol 3-phosphate transport system substrate-binding protein
MRRRGFLEGSLALGAAGLVGACRGSDEHAADLWFSYGGKNREVLLSLVAAFREAHPEHAIRAVYQGDYFELLAKLRTAISADAAPAITHVVGEIVPYLAEANVLERLDAIDELSVDFDLVPELTQAGLFASKEPKPLYALPFNRSTPIAYVNRATFDEAGIAPPTTWDELRAAAKALSRGSGAERRFGFGCPIDWWFWVAMVGQAGGEITDAEGRVTLGGDAGVRALRFWQTLAFDDASMRVPTGRDYNAWQVTNEDFIAGRVAMIWTSTAFLRYIEDHAKFPVLTAPLPRDRRFAVPTGGTMFVMPKAPDGPKKRAAAAFLAFMMRPEQANAFATQTGYIPVSRPGLAALDRAGFFRDHPNAKVPLDQLSRAHPWPWGTQIFRLQREIVQPRLEAAILGREDAAKVLADARRAAEEEP